MVPLLMVLVLVLVAVLRMLLRQLVRMVSLSYPTLLAVILLPIIRSVILVVNINVIVTIRGTGLAVLQHLQQLRAVLAENKRTSVREPTRASVHQAKHTLHTRPLAVNARRGDETDDPAKQ